MLLNSTTSAGFPAALHHFHPESIKMKEENTAIFGY
jgi:hypothetical protein